MTDPAMDIPALHAFLTREFPQVEGVFRIEELRADGVRVRMPVTDANLRPGGTVSGPSMFALADVALYIAILARVGPKALAVTTNCSIDFMRRPGPVDMLAEARLLKLGRSLAVGDALLYSEGLAEPVARAGITYALPPPHIG
ncbi:MAG: PaaI family thioesterase [Rhodobacteraceae bacterium]|jgi:uncharacterized protein (TIGR00369 family)|nr:PaaI family thioesterase [Paracoccaceae bacterium]MBL4558124.1 PaaI family thioesterase [Paracoccaceae bacterium]HBG98360.1 thioesterase [Paracoccaceae bacterium]